MALNENIIKNISNEIARNCQAKHTSVDVDFVTYLVDLLLLNPKYNKLFANSVNRSNLEIFVNTCVSMLTSGDSSINILKIQHIFQTNYDTREHLIEKHRMSIEACLRPLVSEILEAYPDSEEEIKKLFRKISIYLILASGLGNPGVISTLKEGIAALESVFSIDDLCIFVTMPSNEKVEQLYELTELVSGVRLFNRDCNKGGDGIPDLPFDLVDAANACLASLSNALITVMQRVNTLTSAIDDAVIIEKETGNIVLKLPDDSSLTIDDYKQVFSLLAFFRQYELIIRKLLADVEMMSEEANALVEKLKRILEELHAAVKYKAAVPVVIVFPLFKKAWHVWRSMQNEMYLVSTVNKLMGLLVIQQDFVKLPNNVLKSMLTGKTVMTDPKRLHNKLCLGDRMSMCSLTSFVPYEEESTVGFKAHKIQYLGFCAVCICLGALIPFNPQLGFMKIRNTRFGFCSPKMACRFNRDPQRYINEALEYIRNHPHLINLLNVVEDIIKVQKVENLVTKVEPKIHLHEKNIQTEVHPIEHNILRHYSWNLWEHKRRACQWANIVNCRTHSTQTKYSHLRSEIQCQTVEMKDKGLQTKKDCGTNVPTLNTFIWGLRGRYSDGQHVWKLTEDVTNVVEKLKPKVLETCTWPCVTPPEGRTDRDSTFSNHT